MNLTETADKLKTLTETARPGSKQIAELAEEVKARAELLAERKDIREKALLKREEEARAQQAELKAEENEQREALVPVAEEGLQTLFELIAQAFALADALALVGQAVDVNSLPVNPLSVSWPSNGNALMMSFAQGYLDRRPHIEKLADMVQSVSALKHNA